MPVTDPKTRSLASNKIPTKRTSGGHHDFYALNDAFTKNLYVVDLNFEDMPCEICGLCHI